MLWQECQARQGDGLMYLSDEAKSNLLIFAIYATVYTFAFVQAYKIGKRRSK